MTALNSKSDEIGIAWAEYLIFALNNCPAACAAPIVDEWLESEVTTGPIVSLYDIKSDADFWADIATQIELRIYMGAILKRLKDKSFGQASRKNLFITLWESFADADRTAFLSRVDPTGQFQAQGRAA